MHEGNMGGKNTAVVCKKTLHTKSQGIRLESDKDSMILFQISFSKHDLYKILQKLKSIVTSNLMKVGKWT
jgi:hypothetical protein